MLEDVVQSAGSPRIPASETWAAALLDLNDRLRDVTDLATMAFIAAEIVARSLGATAAGYGTMDDDEDGFVIDRNWSAPEVANIAGRYRMQDFGTYYYDLRRGRNVVIPDVRLDHRTIDTVAALEGAGGRSFVNLPVIENGRMVAVFFVLSTSPRQWKTEELAFIRDAAERTRTAVERRRAEHQLQVLNASLEHQVAERTADRNALWELSSDLMLRCTFNGVMTAVNPAWTALLGWREDELLGANLFDFIHRDDMAHTVEGARELSEGTGHARFDNRYRHRDGSYRWISWSTRPAEGLINAVGRDCTSEKEQAEALAKAEEALRQSQKMEAVGQLTGGLAHDFNNLLTGISGSLDLLQKRVAQGRVNDLDRYLIAAQGAAKRAAALTHRLLAFSRRQTLDPKPTNVHKLVLGMTDLIRRTVGPEITVETVDMVGLWPALVDPPQLENALLNLCINARDAMPDGGRITIETANRWMDDRTALASDVEPGQYLSLCVSDTGTGMTPDIVARAFDPFFTTKPLGQGTGLGLSMIYGFARQSGGQVRIYSEVGQGTMICIYLPRHHGEGGDAAPEADQTGETPRAVEGETVLVVDDEPTVRMLVADVLGDLGYGALEAEDGPSGLKILQSRARVDLLVTDVGLPGGMNGRQVADAARVLRPGLKVLFITGYAENAVVGNGHLDPGMAVLTKPFAMDDLAAKIRDLIEE